MAFSSIEEEDRKTVIERCYWPLLRLADDGFPIGIEATSYSLQVIEAIDPDWIRKLRDLISTGAVEFVGSGYTQMIAPLVPAEVTAWNLRFGQQDYERLLGVRPEIALVNEQAYSPGLVPIYLEAGYSAIMMDWSDPSSHNKSWQRAAAHQPHQVIGVDESKITVLWSDAISFQKFQRYARGDIDAEEYFEFLSLQLGGGAKAFPLYTSDAEIFDFRPGRFSTETELPSISEYERIRLLFAALNNSADVTLGMPSDALKLRNEQVEPIQLETASAPVPVKKQRKYNLLRWAVSGRNDLSLNTLCWRQYEALESDGNAQEADWRGLCELWASDYRTHITEKRWNKLNQRLPKVTPPKVNSPIKQEAIPDNIRVHQDRRFITIETDDLHLVLNKRRGLALQSFGFGAHEGMVAGAPAKNALLGTLAHGFYNDIAYGADFYSGHFIFEPGGRHKVTDLITVTPQIYWLPDCEALEIRGGVETPWGILTKQVRLFGGSNKLEVTYMGAIPLPLDGSFRLGHMMLNPNAFDVCSLYYATHNGGFSKETHSLWENGSLVECDHGAAVSRLISATTGLGMTRGFLELGDKEHYIKLSMSRTDAAGIGLVTSKRVDDSFFVRAAISLCEVDETLKCELSKVDVAVADPILRFSISIGKHN